MNNKYIRYCLVESQCRWKVALLVVLIIAMFVQVGYQSKQAAKIRTLEEELVMVKQIPAMEAKMDTYARLEAFKNEDDAALQEIKPSKISGIAMREGEPSVLVDGTVYSEGSIFGEYVIVKITKEMITLVNQKTKAIKNLYVFE